MTVADFGPIATGNVDIEVGAVVAATVHVQLIDAQKVKPWFPCTWKLPSASVQTEAGAFWRVLQFHEPAGTTAVPLNTPLETLISRARTR